jgi:hypothetical protein
MVRQQPVTVVVAVSDEGLLALIRLRRGALAT